MWCKYSWYWPNYIYPLCNHVRGVVRIPKLWVQFSDVWVKLCMFGFDWEEIGSKRLFFQKNCGCSCTHCTHTDNTPAAVACTIQPAKKAAFSKKEGNSSLKYLVLRHKMFGGFNPNWYGLFFMRFCMAMASY